MLSELQLERCRVGPVSFKGKDPLEILVELPSFVFHNSFERKTHSKPRKEIFTSQIITDNKTNVSVILLNKYILLQLILVATRNMFCSLKWVNDFR